MRYLICALLCLLAFPAFADCPDQADLPLNSVCVEWQAPTENVDGSPVPDTGPGSIAQYRLFWSTTVGSYNVADSILINDPTLREFTTAEGTISIPRPPAGGDVDLFLVMTAINTETEESAYSNTVGRVITFPAPVPGEPTILDVILRIEFT